jgi:hypothetical protein
MKLFFLVVFYLVYLTSPISAQSKTENDIDLAYQNAKKGIYWALSNIPEKKAKLDHDLIAEDKLYSRIRLAKEINGVKVVSTGYFQSNEVVMTIYKSYDSLNNEGYNVPNTLWNED